MLPATMFLKLFIVLLAAYSVHASVIAAVFQDDNGRVEVAHRHCNNSACYLYCLRHLFPGGYCFGRTCKCYGGLEDGIEESSDTKASGSCNNLGCDQLSRRLGFRSGVCVGDTCKCDINEEEKPRDVEVSKRTCSSNACNAYCRSHWFLDGYCLGSTCKCYGGFREDGTKKFFITQNRSKEGREDKIDKRAADETAFVELPADCNAFDCNDMCQRMNYIGGMCRAGDCYCF